MTIIPDEWIDKLFLAMDTFYGKRWEISLGNSFMKEASKTIWKNGLCGLDYRQIKNALILCKRHAKDPNVFPPHVMQFFRYAKSESQPDISYHPAIHTRGNSEVARKYIAEIKRNIGI